LVWQNSIAGLQPVKSEIENVAKKQNANLKQRNALLQALIFSDLQLV